MTDELFAAFKQTVGSEGGQSNAKTTVHMSYHKSTSCGTIKKDTGYSSYHKYRCMLIKEASKESRKVRTAALLKELKQKLAGMLRFFFAEKKLDQVQKSKKQNLK